MAKFNSKKQFGKLKRILPLGAVTIFTILLLFRIVPLDVFAPVRQQSLEDFVFAYWLIFVGFVFITLGVLALPSTKNTSGKIASYFLIGFGLISLVFAVISVVEGFDIIREDTNLNFMAIILFTGASIILVVDLISRIISRKGNGIAQTVDAIQ